MPDDTSHRQRVTADVRVLSARYLEACHSKSPHYTKPALAKDPLVPKAELMVQLVVSMISKHKTRKVNGDDLGEMAGWLRSTRNEDAFLRMVSAHECTCRCHGGIVELPRRAAHGRGPAAPAAPWCGHAWSCSLVPVRVAAPPLTP